MKEITILSGKGGTGKTTITAAFASLAGTPVLCDSDVDASDLHLILDPTIRETHEFPGSKIASINTGICSACGICMEYCRFDAISITPRSGYVIDSLKCEGCRLCERICPVEAISTCQHRENFWYVSQTRSGMMVHARMGPGEENSGKLVTQVRRRAKELASALNAAYILNDGPPGIGCPVIASITGAHSVVLVTEPTLSGLHDARRLAHLVNSFKIPIFAIINKHDIHPVISAEMESWFREQGITLLGKIPFSEAMVEAMVKGKSIIEFDQESEISVTIAKAWNILTETLNKI
jgi:MinD superfamily P-loop ATPase